MLSLDKGFWAIYAASMRGSAGGVTVARRPGRWEIQARRKRVVPQGTAPEYWRKVYGRVEDLWNNMSQVDKDTWLYGPKPRGLTPRDYFGRINMSQVGYWSKWVRRRPAGTMLVSRKTLHPDAEPLPFGQPDCLPGTWHQYADAPPVQSAEARSAYADAGTMAGAWAAAWAACLALPWAPVLFPFAHNYGYIGNAPGGFRAYARQARCTFRVGGLDCMAWREPAIRIMTGYPGAGAVDLPLDYWGRTLGPGRINYSDPDIRGWSLNTLVFRSLGDAGGWAPPGQPTATYYSRGWNVDLLRLYYYWRA